MGKLSLVEWFGWLKDCPLLEGNCPPLEAIAIPRRWYSCIADVAVSVSERLDLGKGLQERWDI